MQIFCATQAYISFVDVCTESVIPGLCIAQGAGMRTIVRYMCVKPLEIALAPTKESTHIQLSKSMLALQNIMGNNALAST